MSGWRATGVRFAILVGTYLTGAQLAVLFIETPSQVTLIWPPAGIGFAALLIYGLGWWPFIAVSVVLLHLLVQPAPLAFLPFSIAANVIATVFAVLLARRLAPQATDRLSVVSGLSLLLAGTVLAATSAMIGVPGMVASGMLPAAQFWPAVASWTMGDLFGLVTVTPAALVVARTVQRGPLPPFDHPYATPPERMVWIALALLTLAAIPWAGRHSAAYALGLASLPLAMLLWSALRFPPLFTSVATMLLGLAITTLIGFGVGGLRPPSTLLDTAILLAFMCVLGVVPQMLSAAVHENRVTTQRLFRRATTDPLTRLANRTAFEEQCRARLAGGGEPMALAYVDLDQFKVVNDTASHAAGDELIRELSGALRAALEPDDLLARTGGDEFAVLLRRCPEHALPVRAGRLRDAVAAFRFAWHGHVVAVTASVGAVPVHGATVEFSTLLAEADAACYTAKELGGNQVQIAKVDGGAVEERTSAMRWVMRINDALAHDHFRLHCQGIAALGGEDRGGRHFEVLLRLVDPATGALLPPGPIIAAAERFKLAARLDRWVVDRTLRWLEQHPHAAAETALCSINLSGAAVVDAEFTEFVRARLATSSVSPGRIGFEITETAAVRDLARAQRFIAAVRGLGCRLALDDFGSGFCSFGYIRSLDVDFFKIDGSFVREAHQSPVALAIVRSIAEIARVMRKRTVAECVENDAIRRHLEALGVDYAQGFAIHRPVPIESYFGRPATASDKEVA